MFYVYVLKLGVDKLYIGYTNNLRRRLLEHQKGQSTYTRTRGPVTLVYYEAFRSKLDARKREIKLKKYKNSYTHLKKRISSSVIES